MHFALCIPICGHHSTAAPRCKQKTCHLSRLLCRGCLKKGEFRYFFEISGNRYIGCGNDRLNRLCLFNFCRICIFVNDVRPGKEEKKCDRMMKFLMGVGRAKPDRRPSEISGALQLPPHLLWRFPVEYRHWNIVGTIKIALHLSDQVLV